MELSPRIKIAVLAAFVAGGALTLAGQAGAQPLPVDPALPPAPGVAPPAPNQVFTYTPIAEGGGAIPPPAPPPAGAPYIPPVQGGDFNNTGQMSYLRELWNMRNSAELFNTLYPTQMDPAMAQAMGVRDMPMLAPGELPPGAVPGGVVSPPAPPGAPAAPAPAPPPVWPPAGMVPIATP